MHQMIVGDSFPRLPRTQTFCFSLTLSDPALSALSPEGELLLVGAHVEDEGAAGEDLLAGDAVGEGLAVKGDGGNVKVSGVQALGYDFEPFAVGQVPGSAGDLRSA